MRRIREDTLRVVCLAFAFFGVLALLAWHDGVFETLGDDAIALAAFAAGFIALAIAVDQDLRAWIATLAARREAKPSLGKGLRGHLR